MLYLSSHTMKPAFTLQKWCLEKEDQIYRPLFKLLSLNCRSWEKHLVTQFSWVNFRPVVICLDPINPLNGLFSVRFRWCAGPEILWLQERCSVPISWPSWYITFKQYSNVEWLCRWKIDTGVRTYVLALQINVNSQFWLQSTFVD